MTGNVNRSLLWRAVILFGILLLAFVALGVRIAVIQTAEFEKYEEKVIEQMTTRSPADANRGEIYDRNGNVLATNVTTYRVFLSPSAISRAQKKLDGKKTDSLSDKIATGLAEHLGMDREKIYGKTQKVGRLDETVLRDVDEKSAAAVRDWMLREDMIGLVFLEATSKRYYPYGSLASHVIGFTSSDGVGLYGLEYQYEKLINGTDGYYETARDSRGNEMPGGYQRYIAPVDGADITTTLDCYVQSVLEEQLENAVYDSGALNRATGIVMDVESGEILALAVYPSYDLNSPRELPDYYKAKLTASGYAIGSEEYSALASRYLLEAWSNKALTETYIPGSTFKILTSSMALEEELPLLNSAVFCGGAKTVLGHSIHCHKRKGHGMLDFAGGIQHSCNVWFMTIGQNLGVERFTEYFKRFGYREKTGVDLPGEGMGVFSSRMTELDLAIYSFGQNFTVTAMQHITAIAAVANRGSLLTPYTVSQATDKDGKVIMEQSTAVKRQVVEPSTSTRISEILAAGVAGEGGAKNAYVPGYRIAAKTGTSEKKGETTTGREMYICSCVGYAPADAPRIAVIIMVDEPTLGYLYGSTVAAPYIGNTMAAILPYLGIEAVYTEEEKAVMDAAVPNYVGLEVKTAVEFAEERGLSVEVVGEGSHVITQSPKSGELYSKGSGKVVFYTDGAVAERVSVPSVIGKGVSEANLILTNAGLNIRVSGAFDPDGKGGAVVVSQSLAEGSEAVRGSIVEICLRYMIADG